MFFSGIFNGVPLKNKKSRKTLSIIEEEREKLYTHPIFTEFTIIETIRLDGLQISDPIKKRMSLEYLKILFNEIDLMVCDMVDRYPEPLNNSAQFASKVYEAVKNVRSRALEAGVVPIFIEKYGPRSFETLSTLTNIIIEVHQHRIFRDNYGAMCEILTVMLAYLRISIDQVEGIVSGMNGELSRALEGSVFDI